MNKIINKIKTIALRSILLSLPLGGVGGGLLMSCNKYLDIIPENNLAVDYYWSSKADVKSSLSAGYYYLRASVEGYFLPWGEQRAGVIHYTGSTPLQNYTIKATTSYANWAQMYKIIKEANLVLAHAKGVQANDQTYTDAEVNSHYCEAYYLRALAYFYLVRNWRNVPIIDESLSYETDEDQLKIGQSSESDVLAFIKSDLSKADSLGAAKDYWDTTWETKGKATKWSIYALMADVCLWSHDFDTAITYCDKILKDTSGNAPKFIEKNNRTSWFAIFNPGNSDESVYEIQWSADKTSNNTAQTNGLYDLFNDGSTNQYVLSDQTAEDFKIDRTTAKQEAINKGTSSSSTTGTDYSDYVRTDHGTYYQSGSNLYVWKYLGDNTGATQKRTIFDNNFIIYRVSEVMLIKAEALLMRTLGQNEQDITDAMNLVNQIRERTNLDDRQTSGLDLRQAMEFVYYERIMEFVGEGKAWYDFLRLGRYSKLSGAGQFDFKSMFVNYVVTYNKQATESRIRSVLMNENAWYLPVYDSELKANDALVQNAYYQ